MKTVFLLEHTYEYENEDENDKIITTATKTLGIFSSKEKADQAIQFYKTLPGFKDHPDDCFNVDEFDLDVKGWETGFVTVEGILEREESETPEGIEYDKECLRDRIREKQEELKELQEDLNKYESQ